jgi:hypothetical protein
LRQNTDFADTLFHGNSQDVDKVGVMLTVVEVDSQYDARVADTDDCYCVPDGEVVVLADIHSRMDGTIRIAAVAAVVVDAVTSIEDADSDAMLLLENQFPCRNC